MSLWVRAIEFAFYWLLFGGALLGVCKLMSRTSRSSNAGFLARIGGSLLLGPLGLFVGLYHVVTLGVILANNYQLLLPSFGWCIWASGAAAAAVPWLIRGPEHRPPETSDSSAP
ncbi:MAG: hypothetical protein K1X57_06925 [Gemmataceae bacterium]|nr:hypothetical protein [Gemmataceae bacterium]